MATTPLVDVQSQNTELTGLNQNIQQVQKNLEAFNDPESYLGLLKTVATTAYDNNKDLIEFRRQARAQLYGEQTPYTPQNFYQLRPEQQAQIRNAPRAGLVAAIQSANETEVNRGQRIEDVLSIERASQANQRQTLTDQLSQL